MKFCPFCLKENPNDSKFCEGCGQNFNCNIPIYHLAVGTLLNGKYVVGKAIGEGGFGITYIGKDIKLDMLVAIKEYFPNGYVNRSNTLSSALTCSIDTERKNVYVKGLKRFLDEARALAKFAGTEGIVDVRDFFEENNTAYIVMEYLDGQTLKTFLEYNGRLSDWDTVELLMPVMQALKNIHNSGLIHRDISPDNIMLMEGKIKLLDFGAVRDVSGSGNKSMTVTLKHGYAPEEQYREHGEQGAWTDVYALCATMYKCITGVIPEDAMERMVKDEVLWPTEMGIGIHYDFEKVLMKGMSIFAKDRYRNMDEFINAIMSTELFGKMKSGNNIPENKSFQKSGIVSDDKKIDGQERKKAKKGIGGKTKRGLSDRTLFLISLIPAIPLIAMIIIMFLAHPVDYNENAEGNVTGISDVAEKDDEAENKLRESTQKDEKQVTHNKSDNETGDNTDLKVIDNKNVRPESILGVTDTENLTYVNEYFGIGCSLNKEWKIASKAEIEQTYVMIDGFDYDFAVYKPGYSIMVLVSNDELPVLNASEEEMLKYIFGATGYESKKDSFLGNEHITYSGKRVVDNGDGSAATLYDKAIAIKRGLKDFLLIYLVTAPQNFTDNLCSCFYSLGEEPLFDKDNDYTDERVSYQLYPLWNYSIVETSSTFGNDTEEYGKDKLMDNNDSTCWRANSGENEYIEFEFTKPVSIFDIELHNGNLKSEKSYKYYSMVKKVQVEFDGGLITMQLEEIPYEKTKTVTSHIGFNNPITTKKLRITVLETYPGKKYSEVCVSDIAILAIGRPYVQKVGSEEKAYLQGTEFTIGSKSDSNYVIGNTSGTSYAVKISKAMNAVYYIENTAKRKVSVDGEKLSKGDYTMLKDGSMIEIGNNTLIFGIE